MKTTAMLSLAALALAAGSVNAAQYVWDWNVATPNPNTARSNAAGTFKSIHTEFNSDTNRYLLSVVFSDRVTNGLAIRVGDRFSGIGRGEQGIMYLDATTLSSPKLTAYAYNGQSWATSYYDGNGSAFGTPAPDVIHTSTQSAWKNTVTAVNTANNTRTFTVDIDASTINGHTPLYPGSNGVGAWDGVRFANTLGLWINTFDNLSTSYSYGKLSCFGSDYCGNEGYFNACDSGNLVIVPLPPAAYAGIAGLGLVGLVARRRAKNARIN